MEKVELSDRHIVLRLVLAAVFLVAGASALAYSVSQFFTGSSGWREIGTLSADGITCSTDFTFMYDLGRDGSVSKEKRELTSIYSAACKTAYELFNASESFDSVNNICAINHAVNTDIPVDPALYEAFSEIKASGDRSVFLGPAYEIYNGIFTASTDDDALAFDPVTNPDLKELFAEISGYARDPESVDIKLLGGNKIRLEVSKEYADFMASQELNNYIDFYSLKNAFITDYLCKTVTDAGFTHGVITSKDGFSRSLGSDSLSFTVYKNLGGTVYPAAVMNYQSQRSVVYLRGYMLSTDDSFGYRYLSGSMRTPYLSTSDGLPHTSSDDLVGYSDSKTCAEVLLDLLPIYTAQTFPESEAKSLSGSGTFVIYSTDENLKYTDPSLDLSDILSSPEVKFSATYSG